MEDVETGITMTDAGAQLYEDLMRFKPEGMTANAWAVQAGVSRTIWSDLRRHGNPSRRTLERLLSTAGSSLAEFEALRFGDAPPPETRPGGILADPSLTAWRAPPLSPIPVVETYPDGEWRAGIELAGLRPGRIQGHVDRPRSMAADRDAYALTMFGGAMWPRFRKGRRLLVSPALPVSTGDDVVVRLRSRTDGEIAILIGELMRRTADFIELRQFTPDITFRLETADVEAVHKVMGEAI